MAEREPKWNGKTLSEWMSERMLTGVDQQKQKLVAANEHPAVAKDIAYRQTYKVDPITGAIVVAAMPVLEPAWQATKGTTLAYNDSRSKQVLPDIPQAAALKLLFADPVAKYISAGMAPGGAKHASEVNMFGNVPDVAKGAYEGYMEAFRDRYGDRINALQGMLSKYLR